MAVGHRARAHPRALCSAPPAASSASRASTRCRDEGRPPPRAGDHRVRLLGRPRPPVRLRDPDQRAEWWPFYTKCAELDVPVVFQVGHSAEFMPSACGKPILLDDIAIWFPELKLVGGHTGWPWTEELISMAWKHPNVYIACSGHAPKYWDPKLVQVPQLAQPRHRQGDVGDRLPADPARREPARRSPSSTSSPRRSRRCCTTPRRTCSRSPLRPRPRPQQAPAPTADAGGPLMDSTGSTPDRVLVEVVDGLATVTLNRPEKLNALDVETYRDPLVARRRAGRAGGRAARSCSRAPAARSAPAPT